MIVDARNQIQQRFGNEVDTEVTGAVAGGLVETPLHITAGASASVALQEIYEYIKVQYDINHDEDEEIPPGEQLHVSLHIEVEGEQPDIVEQARENERREENNRSLSEFNEE